MKGKGFAFRQVFVCAMCGMATASTLAQQRSTVQDASLTLRLFPELGASGNIRLETADASQPLVGEVEFLVSGSTPISLVDKGGSLSFASPQFRIEPPIRIIADGHHVDVSEFVWTNELSATEAASLSNIQSVSGPSLQLRGFRVGIGDGLLAQSESILISPALARKLGNESLAGVSLGTAILNGHDQTQRASGSKDEAVREEPNTIIDTETPTGEVAAPGPDMTFCQLYGLQQFGRLGDIVGLALATTSWNVGGRDMIWMNNPDPRHPMIVWNIYRLKNDRFEQIGMSHVKHGFFALGDAQCGGSCSYEAGHGPGDWLGQNCTDTYSSSLNAGQSGLGPRYEINPWTGGYTYAGSHLSTSHSHNAIQHRCQVRDSDLASAQNPGATYYAEGQYITTDDVNPVNSIGWKTVTVSGTSGGTWTFGMSGSGTQPNTGPAINAWVGATQTVLAQQSPVVRFTSPDGRCILGHKVTDLGGGLWHYEYALYNLDMHRKAKSFNIPVPNGVNISNVGFSAVLSHDEPYSNTPWSSVVDSSGVTWSTIDNPIRWGMMYNFRFDADVPPGAATVTVGLYEPGTPASISGTTEGPFLANPAPDPQVDPSGISKSRFVSTMIPEANVAAGSPTALRITLTSLHHPDPQYTAGIAADFSAFEGEVRWVGPPTEYTESSTNPTTFHAATLQCTPFYQDWSSVGVLHITGREIVPSSVYTLENVAITCQGNEAGCTEVSSGLEIKTNRWADIVAPFSDQTSAVQPDISDVSGLVDKFRNAPGAPIKVQALLVDEVPNMGGDVDFTQISAAVDAFRGYPYPQLGPEPCP